MLDQLVAFCGEKISETDVLDVFGFTSEQTVIDLTGHIFNGETPEAIDLLHQQSESGKDMMRLMADLIAYLRDLLVLKAKPDALNEDVDPDVQKSLAAQAKLISTDRLLEMIDQFAASEGRMKWAPNKKLHFEVAIIKAIQSLGQATLDEVIEKLGELRDGGKGPPVVGIGDPGPQNKSDASKLGIADPGYEFRTPRIEEKAVEIDPEKIWQQVLAKIPAKSFLRTLTELLLPIGADERNFLVGHSPADKSKIETIASVSNRRQLETLLGEVSGREWSVKFVAKEGIHSSTAIETTKSAEPFKDDPLINEAIELFNARVSS
jgi:DNA polymerase III gamma/tau subunit